MLPTLPVGERKSRHLKQGGGVGISTASRVHNSVANVPLPPNTVESSGRQASDFIRQRLRHSAESAAGLARPAVPFVAYRLQLLEGDLAVVAFLPDVPDEVDAGAVAFELQPDGAGSRDYGDDIVKANVGQLKSKAAANFPTPRTAIRGEGEGVSMTVPVIIPDYRDPKRFFASSVAGM